MKTPLHIEELFRECPDVLMLFTSLVSETWIAGQCYNILAVQKAYDKWLVENKDKIMSVYNKV